MIKTLAKLQPHELHKLVMDRLLAQKEAANRGKTDIDVIREHHRFLWDDDDGGGGCYAWERQLAKKYYDKLFKEYCICDLTRYKENKIAMRWRIEREVVLGVGQFICGNKHCGRKEGDPDGDTAVSLRSWEVNFNYVEHGEKKNALVKLRLCQSCSRKLNYHSKKRLIKKERRRKLVPIDDAEDARERRRRRGRNSGEERQAEEEEDGEASGPPRKADDNDEEESMDGARTNDNDDGHNLWSNTSQTAAVERSREEEFNEYLEDLLL